MTLIAAFGMTVRLMALVSAPWFSGAVWCPVSGVARCRIEGLQIVWRGIGSGSDQMPMLISSGRRGPPKPSTAVFYFSSRRSALTWRPKRFQISIRQIERCAQIDYALGLFVCGFDVAYHPPDAIEGELL